MLDKEMDNIIKEAAEKHDPAYNDMAWTKMNSLLDKQLLQKDNRRKFFYFFLLLLCIGTGAYFARPYLLSKENKPGTIAENQSRGKNSLTIPVQQRVADPVLPNDQSNPNLSAGKNEVPDNNVAGNYANYEPVDVKSDRFIGFRKQIVGKNKISMKIKAADIPADNATDQEILPGKNDLLNARNVVADKPRDSRQIKVPVQEKRNNLVTVPEKRAEIAGQPVMDTTKPESNKVPDDKGLAKRDKKGNRKGFGSNFGFNFSAGPDISFVHINNPGKITLAYGAGLHYTLANRITLRAGFYVTRKKYSTDSAGYSPPAGFWNYYPNMQNIDADCKVYDVPVSIQYHFNKKKGRSWYAAAGISSYLMKKEVYDYSYKSSSGQPYYRTYSYSNKNNHLFAALTFSGGYQVELNKNISFSAEPYYTIPLKGIGFGNVKLKSGGILFSASLKPFAKMR